MAVIISGIAVKGSMDKDEIIYDTLKRCGIDKSDCIRVGIHKLSLDARKRNDIHYVASVLIEMDNSNEIALENKLCDDKYIKVSRVDSTPLVLKKYNTPVKERPVICGFGPAGMFAALVLAESGLMPIVIERGQDANARSKAVETFWNKGKLDVNSNVQFGEGGAGTFSDGKLTTRIKDPLCRYILEKFVEFGAPEDILINAKAHIGTDKLICIVKKLRERIIELGGEVRFNSKLTDITIKNGKLESVTVNNCDKIDASALILAIGHSARDTFEMLYSKGIDMEAKAFAVGARIEHLQEAVNESLYGKNPMIKNLPVGEYNQAYTENGRGVYTFCMCPGGFVVPSQSEENTIVTNGMSKFARDGVNANSALVCSVSPKDFGMNALDGMYFARDIEKKAFLASGGNYTAPCVTVKSFLDKSYTLKGASIKPSYSIGVTPCEFERFLPDVVTDSMRIALGVFSRRMKCFGDKSAILTGPETRTSSPVRIVRGDDKQSPSVKGLYPCGEGAGYAGGIMSAAVDGVKQALAVIDNPPFSTL